MRWRLEYSEKARKQLRKLDSNTRAMILLWMDSNVEGCDNPRAHGRQLVGNLAGSWRYRIGDYRIICDVQDDRTVVLALQIAHRREAYGRRRKS